VYVWGYCGSCDNWIWLIFGGSLLWQQKKPWCELHTRWATVDREGVTGKLVWQNLCRLWQCDLIWYSSDILNHCWPYHWFLTTSLPEELVSAPGCCLGNLVLILCCSQLAN